jgi:hypothetical protein
MKLLALLALLPSLALADSSITTGSGKLSTSAHVDFKIIIPLIVGVNDSKAFNNAKKSLAAQTKSCDANNVCTVTMP